MALVQYNQDQWNIHVSRQTNHNLLYWDNIILQKIW